jgi:hypothetical protein
MMAYMDRQVTFLNKFNQIINLLTLMIINEYPSIVLVNLSVVTILYMIILYIKHHAR